MKMKDKYLKILEESFKYEKKMFKEIEKITNKIRKERWKKVECFNNYKLRLDNFQRVSKCACA